MNYTLKKIIIQKISLTNVKDNETLSANFIRYLIKTVHNLYFMSFTMNNKFFK